MSARLDCRAREKRESFFSFLGELFFIKRFSPTPVRTTHSTLISFGPNFIYKPENILPIPKTPINLALESTQPVDFFLSTHTRVRVTGCVLVPPDADMFFSMPTSRHGKNASIFLLSSAPLELDTSTAHDAMSARAFFCLPSALHFLMDSDAFPSPYDDGNLGVELMTPSHGVFSFFIASTMMRRAKAKSKRISH